MAYTDYTGHNTLTAVLPTLYSAANIIPRKMTGLIGSCDRTFDAKEAAMQDTVTVPVLAASSNADYTPAMQTTIGSSTTPTSVTMTLEYSRQNTFVLSGEEQRSLDNGGDLAKEFLRQKTEGAIGAAIDEIEAYLIVKAKEGASRATGTAGTTPFATTISEIADVRKILIDNGMAMDTSLVLTSAAATNLRKLVTINNQPAGSPAEEILRGGTLVNLHGMAIKESAGAVAHTIGTASGTLMSATEPVGETSLAYDTDTNGPWTAGDVVTLGSGGGSGSADTNKYIVSAANTATPLLINAPGLLLQHVDNDTMTVGAAYTPCIALDRRALKLVVRPPYTNQNPLIESVFIGDPLTGLTFRFDKIAGDGVVTYRIVWVYGAKVINSQGVAILMS